jgi:alpha/beta superfamily hydrolase
MFRGSAHALEGLLWLPPSPAKCAVVICHPHPQRGGDMHNNVVHALAGALQRSGHATLRFNFRGVGDSGGRFDGGTGEADDVRSAIAELCRQADVATVAVAGYSFGAMVGLRAGADDPSVARLIGIAPPIAMRDFSFLRGVAKPKLLVSGERDDFCPQPALEALFGSLAEPKQLRTVRHADHFFNGLEVEIGEAAVDFLDEPP